MKKILISLLYLFSIITTTLSESENPCKDIIMNSSSESEIQSKILSEISTLKNYPNKCIDQLLLTSKYKALETYLIELNKLKIHFREMLSSSINTLSKTLEAINNKYKYQEKDYQVVSPAFQWTQNNENIYIEVKFAHRMDSPGCLEVEKLTSKINGNNLLLSGYCVLDDFPIKFVLDLNLFGEIVEDYSDFKYGSVGRYQMKIKKMITGKWDRLLSDENVAINNMKVWYEMKRQVEDAKTNDNNNNPNQPGGRNIDDDDDGFKSIEEIQREIREERKRERKLRKLNKKKNKEDL